MYYDGRRWKNDDTGRMKILTDKVAESIKKKNYSKVKVLIQTIWKSIDTDIGKIHAITTKSKYAKRM